MHSRELFCALTAGAQITRFGYASGLLVVLLAGGGAGYAQAQAQAPAQRQALAGSADARVPLPILAAVTGTAWASLTPAQRAALAPLEQPWSGLGEGQRRKWLAIAATYHGLPKPEREKLHSRMVEWAALSPKQHEAARLNFAQSKNLAKSDRTTNWEAYQSLSPQEREKLALGAKPKPAGAAVAVKPVTPDKLTAVPVTRHTPEPQRAAVVAQMPINRSTLLPQSPAGASSGTSASAPVKP